MRNAEMYTARNGQTVSKFRTYTLGSIKQAYVSKLFNKQLLHKLFYLSSGDLSFE